MEIRKSTRTDEDAIMAIFRIARNYMWSHGNPTQWDMNYPSREVLARDIEGGNSYVVASQGAVVGTFSFIIGVEETYRIIEDGAWHREEPYGTIHRLASNGQVKGIAQACFDFCAAQMDYLRIDTHRDNQAMRGAIERYGFQRCGIIHVRNGSERIAYDWVKGSLGK